jgi:uncharacterized membrane protein (UPF0127 family)
MEIVVARGLRRLVGLIGRRDWPVGVALEIPRCRSVHTVGMRFALDLVWLDSERSVVRVDWAVRPWRVRSCRGARSVLELRAVGRAGELRLGREAESWPGGLSRDGAVT